MDRLGPETVTVLEIKGQVLDEMSSGRENIHLHLHKCLLLHNLQAMQENLHRGNREETGGPLPQTPTRRKTKLHRCVQTSRAPF